jgi:hypothetical protein
MGPPLCGRGWPLLLGILSPAACPRSWCCSDGTSFQVVARVELPLSTEEPFGAQPCHCPLTDNRCSSPSAQRPPNNGRYWCRPLPTSSKGTDRRATGPTRQRRRRPALARPRRLIGPRLTVTPEERIESHTDQQLWRNKAPIRRPSRSARIARLMPPR